MSKLITKPLTEHFGMEIQGLEIAKGVSADQWNQLIPWIYEFQLLLIRDQDLNPEALARFGRHWTGKTRKDGFTEMNVPGFDDINIVGNVGKLFEDDGYRNGAAFWHTDCAAEKEANALTLIYCIHAQQTGGETIFADMGSAFRALDDSLADDISGLVAMHCYAGSRPILGGRESWEFPLTPVSDDTADAFPDPVERDVVRIHSITGNPSLYAPGGSAFSIKGMADKDANTLMRKLKLHATQPQFCYTHKYRPGDLLIWDNTSTMHHATPIDVATGEHDKRMMYRMCALGLPQGMSQSS